MTSRVARLWAEERLPGWDGLYYSDDSAREVRFDASRSGRLEIGQEFDLNTRLTTDPGWLSTILGTVRAPLPDGSGALVYGECAHGSEGYFARLDQQGNLIWVVYLGESNPFIEVDVRDSIARFTTNLGTSVEIDLASPEFGTVRTSRTK